ncbi:hypothetical protein L7F22_016231, partial [Adiantum nelumboides]|nr:hypothetical protein [Adiantum nelumboides]
MALHEALTNGLVAHPSPSQQNPFSLLKQIEPIRVPTYMLPPLNMSGANFQQGMSANHVSSAGMSGFSSMAGQMQIPSYATTVRGGLETMFGPSAPLASGLLHFPHPYVNPLWSNEGERDKKYIDEDEQVPVHHPELINEPMTSDHLENCFQHLDQAEIEKDFMDTSGLEHGIPNLDHEGRSSSSSELDEETIPSSQAPNPQ